MQIKSQQKVNKKVLNAIFTDIKQNTLIKNNVGNIGNFFQLFNKIKEHRTLEKMCQVYTVEQKQLIFNNYVKLIDELQTLMDKFQEYTKKISIRKNIIKIQHTRHSLDQWKQAIHFVIYKGQAVTQVLEQKLRLIIKGMRLNLQIPFIDWQRWLQNCTEQIYIKKGCCGCF